MSILSNPPTVSFSGNDLNQVPGLVITSRDIFETGSRTVNSQKLARTDKSILTTAEYASKMITISFAIVQDSRQSMENALDILNSLLQDIEGVLQITQNGQTRSYTATLISTTTDSTDPQGNPGAMGGFLQKTLTFQCSDPFGYDGSTTILLSPTTISSASQSITMAVGGSFKVSPTITLSVTAVSGGTGGVLQITNSATGLGVTISRDFTAGDIIEINGTTGIVTVNGVIFNATGKIPLFVPGLRTLGYVDNFTTRTVVISAVYTKRYI